MLSRAVEAIQPLVNARKHTLAVEAEPGLYVRGDATRLQQVFVNLFSNAAKYTREGGRIQVLARRLGGEAVISVSDNGVGLAADLPPARVRSVHSGCTPPSIALRAALASALPSSSHLIEMHGGAIAAHSDGVNRGSTFTVRLPLLVDVQPPDAAQDENGGGLPLDDSTRLSSAARPHRRRPSRCGRYPFASIDSPRMRSPHRAGRHGGLRSRPEIPAGSALA